jgi:hypothetical protein
MIGTGCGGAEEEGALDLALERVGMVVGKGRKEEGNLAFRKVNRSHDD